MFKKGEKTKTIKTATTNEDQLADWLTNVSESDEGHLSVDVYQSGDSLIVKSTIAGARPEDLEVSVTGDILTIKGERHLSEDVDYNDYLYRECYWGKFSRTVILPVQIDETAVEANLENGVLTVVLPKLKKTNEVKIEIKNDL